MKTLFRTVPPVLPWAWILLVLTLNFLPKRAPAPLSRERVIEIAQQRLKEHYERVFAYTNVLDDWHVAGVQFVPEKFIATGFLTNSNGVHHGLRWLEFKKDGNILSR
ncbi:MAG: hypothetical protein HYR88_03160 [Verrucomicrobia bacterium]|nr:hypothetical protein [Verrucomicrobiota bacterium]MBI3866958.1 hypothetical protein [Verrucomicrobiota bacterium]